MIQGKKLFFFLHNDVFLFYYRDKNGTVKTTTTPTPIDVGPAGWDKISIKWKRSTEFWGMDRTFTVPLDFVEDGADILKEIAYELGTETFLFLTVAKQRLELDFTANTYGFVYGELFSSQPDWNTFVHDGPRVTLSLLDGGLAKIIKNKKDQIYEIDIDVPEAVGVQHTGINIKQKVSWLIPENFILSGGGGVFNISVGAFVSSTEGTSSGVLSDNSTWMNLVGFDLATDLDRWILYTTEQPVVFDFTGGFNVSIGAGSDLGIYFQTSSGTIIDILPFTNYATDTTLNVPVNVSVNLPVGERLFLLVKSRGQMTFYESQVFSQYFTKFKTTIPKYLKANYVGQKLLDKMTGTTGVYVFDSLLMRINEGYLLTCGDALRLLVGSKMKISFSAFFKWIDVCFCAGMAVVDGVLKIEERGFVFNGNNTYLDFTKTPVIKRASDLLVNKIRIGFENQTYDNVNGRDEPNTTAEYTTPRTSVTKAYDMVSPVRMDMFGIEFQRYNLTNKTTTDSSSDNDLFAVVAVAVGGDIWPLDRSENALATGLIDPASAFNLRVRHSLLIRRHGWFIRSIHDKMDSKKLEYQTADKNQNLIVNGVADNADILIGSLDAPKFQPWMIEIETKVPDDYELLMNGTAVRTYTFGYNGIVGRGIAFDSGVNPGDEQTQVFNILLDSGINIAKFKKIKQ